MEDAENAFWLRISSETGELTIDGQISDARSGGKSSGSMV